MVLDIDKYIEHEISSHKETLAALCEIISLPFGDLVRESKNVIINNGKIVFFGNGGSAADAQHLATELAVRYIKNRPPIASVALNTDTSSLTAIG